ncbi:MAG: histidine kinase N-terminal 7TM domain-containing protein [Mongoliitalea sp.]
MNPTLAFNPLSIPVFATGILFLILYFLSVKTENQHGERYFSFLMITCFFYGLLYGLELSAVNLDTLTLFFKLEFMAGVFIAPFLLLFILKYSDKSKYINPLSTTLFFGISFFFLMMIWTNEIHHLFYKEISGKHNGLFFAIQLEYGPLHWAYAIYNSILIIMSNVILIRMLSSTPKIYQKQIWVMLIGTLVPWSAHWIAVTGNSPYNLDLIPFALAFSALIIFWALYKYGFFKSAPIAFKTIFNNINEGVIIYDQTQKMVAHNLSADKFLQTTKITEFGDLSTLGKYIKELDKLRDGSEKSIYISDPSGEKYFELSFQIYDDKKVANNYFFLTIRNVTDQKNAESRIKRNEQKLQNINLTLLRSEKMLTSIAFATKELLSNPNFTLATQKAISLLGDGAGVDRAYLFEASKDEEGDYYISQRFEWSANGVPPEIDNPNLQNIPLGIFGEEAFTKFLKNQYFYSIVEKIEEDTIREFLQFQGIKTIILIPVFVEKEFWGLVGFDDCTEEKEWSEAETALLISFADSISNAVERKKLEESLRTSMEQAREASTAKSEFLANMSHEIRTPLNGVIGFADLLIKTDLKKEQKEYIGSIMQSGKLLLNLINDILDFSKIEAGKLELSLTPCNINEIAKESLKLISPTADQKNLNLILFVDPQVPEFVIADMMRVKQILINLLSNAAKFTSQGEIELKINLKSQNKSTNRSRIEFAVRDTGIGISDEKKQIIFEAFAQEDNSTTRKYGGTGLGLTICNKLLELMESGLSVESELNKGSVFSFELELEHTQQSNDPKKISETNKPLQKKSTTKTSTDDQLRILLVDDNPVNMLLAKTIVKNIIPKAKILEAKNGLEAVEQFNAHNPSMIFMDIQMPEMSGYEATTVIRNIEQNKDSRVPIIALTAGTVKGEYEKCLAIGMDAYLSKPVLVADIENVLEKYIGLPDKKSTEDKPVLSRYEEFREADPEFFRELLEISYGNLTKLQGDLSIHLKENDLNLLKQTGHALKGLGLNLDLPNLTLLATNVEKVTDLGQEATEKVASLNQEINFILENIDKELNQLS